MTKLITTLGILAGLAAAAGCKTKIDRGKAETGITTALAARGLKVKVTCPEGRAAKKGDVFTCDVALDTGEKLTAKVTQQDDDGNVLWDLDGPVVDTDKIVAAVKAQQPDAVVTCAKKVIVLPPNGSATCDVEAGGQKAKIEITAAPDGQFAWKVVP